jgi:hypothetical protein
MQTQLYTDSSSVLHEISRLIKKRDDLKLIYSFTNYRNVKILFSSTNPDKLEQMIWLTNEMMPFHLPNEIANLLEDAIDEYEKDIQTLNFHLKNL